MLASGPEAVTWWRKRKTDATISFRVNPPEPRIRLATAKDKKGNFVVDCISTDGGGIPRNVTVAMGLPLVKLQTLSIEEFVIKTSLNPAMILGLVNKGHLGIGADADISVIDLQTSEVDMTLSRGRIVTYKGYVCGRGTCIITTPAGASYVKQKGLDSIVVDPNRTPFLSKRS